MFYKSVMDGRTNGRTDGQTDRPGYSDARTHLNKAVYTAYVAPSRPKSKSITYGRTDGRTDTHSYRVASSQLKRLMRKKRNARRGSQKLRKTISIILLLTSRNKAQRPTMRPQAFLGISSYREVRDARRKSEYGNSHL